MRYAARWPDLLALGLYPLIVLISFVLRPLAWTLQSQWLRLQAADAHPSRHREPAEPGS